MVGTTVTPWGQFFIQAYVVDKALGPEDLPTSVLDVGIGAIATVIVMFFIVVATAATIHATGGSIVDAEDAARGARAVRRPVRRRAVRARSAERVDPRGRHPAAVDSYATCEAFGFELGLDRAVRDAPVFYGVFIGSIVIGATLVLLPGVSLVPILFLSAVVNGVLLAPILIYLGCSRTTAS